MKLTTAEIQMLVIALIDYRADRVITEAEKESLINKLVKMNCACTPENEYSLTVLTDAV